MRSLWLFAITVLGTGSLSITAEKSTSVESQKTTPFKTQTVEDYRNVLIGKDGTGGEIEKLGKSILSSLSPTDEMRTRKNMVQAAVHGFIDRAYDPAWKQDKQLLHEQAELGFDFVQSYLNTLSLVARGEETSKAAAQSLFSKHSELARQSNGLNSQLKEAWKWGRPKHLRMILEVFVALNRVTGLAVWQAAKVLSAEDKPPATPQHPPLKTKPFPSPEKPFPGEYLGDKEKKLKEQLAQTRGLKAERERLRQQEEKKIKTEQKALEKKLAREQEEEQTKQDKLQELAESGINTGIPLSLRLLEIGTFRRLLSLVKTFEKKAELCEKKPQTGEKEEELKKRQKECKELERELKERKEEIKESFSAIYNAIKVLAITAIRPQFVPERGLAEVLSAAAAESQSQLPRFNPKKFDAVTMGVPAAVKQDEQGAPDVQVSGPIIGVLTAIDDVRDSDDVVVVANRHVAVCRAVFQRVIVFSKKLESNLLSYANDFNRLNALMQQNLGKKDSPKLVADEIEKLREKFNKIKGLLVDENLTPDKELAGRLDLDPTRKFSREFSLYKGETRVMYENIGKAIEALKTEPDKTYRSDLARSLVGKLLADVKLLSDPEQVRARTMYNVRITDKPLEIKNKKASWEYSNRSFEGALLNLENSLLVSSADSTHRSFEEAPTIDAFKDALRKRFGLGPKVLGITGDILSFIQKVDKDLDEELRALNKDLDTVSRRVWALAENIVKKVEDRAIQPFGELTAQMRAQITGSLGGLEKTITDLREPTASAGLPTLLVRRGASAVLGRLTEDDPLALVGKVRTGTGKILASLEDLQKNLGAIPKDVELSLEMAKERVAIIQNTIDRVARQKSVLLASLQATLIKLVTDDLSALTTTKDKKNLLREILRTQIVKIPEIVNLMVS